MSGAAVFDVERNLVVGFVFQVWDSAESQKDRDLAFAVDAAVLSASPVGELLVRTVLQHDPMPEPELDRVIVSSVPAPRAAPNWAIETAPDVLGVFVGRQEHLDFLDETWREGRTRILGLSGFNGQGKTSLVRHWLDRQGSSPHRPPGVLWWTFDPITSEVDDFLAAVITHVSAGAFDPALLPLGTAKANLAASLLQSDQRHVLVLDGLDGLMADSGELAGSFTSEALKDFLGYVAAGQHRSLCILTGARDFSDLEYVATFEGLPVGRLPTDEGRLLLRSNGAFGTDQVLDEIVEDWEGHPLALSAVAAYLRSQWSGVARRLVELPGTSADLPFATRLQVIGDVIEQRRSLLEREAIAFLALARLPLPLTVLAEMASAFAPGPGGHGVADRLGDLAESDVVRITAGGELLLHPVLRSLYRTRLRRENPDSLRSRHRMLAEYYYSAALAGSVTTAGAA
jgi:hypothetical protein